MNQQDEIDSNGGISGREVLGVAWRGRHLIVVPIVVGVVAAAIAGAVMSPVYVASSTLLIESPQIPATLVASPFENLADERIGKIRQQILSRPNLLRLIKRENLYPEQRASQPIENVLVTIRDAISVELVSANAGTIATTARSADPTIAFSLGFRYDEPDRAFRVARELTAMFLEADKKLRTEQAAGATEFLQERADELRDRLIEAEDKRREIQLRFAGALPEQIALSTQTSAALQSEVSRIDSEIQSINQQNVLLAGRSNEMAQADPPARAEVRRAEQALARLRATLSDQHPDVMAAREAVSLAQQAERNEPQMQTASGRLSEEISGGRSRIAVLSQRRGQLLAAIANGERQLAQSPQAAYELNNLNSDLENLRQQYVSIREKQLEAQVAANLQIENKGERFSVVDPPTLPLEPISPRRLQLLMIGAVVGLALGLLLTLAMELITGRVNGASRIARLTGALPLATIPMMKPGPLSGVVSSIDRVLLWHARRRGL